MTGPTAAAPARSEEELSTFRLYAMRFLYLLIVVALGSDVWPRVLGAGEPLGRMDGVAYSFWATLSLLALVGLRYPLKMVPLLLVQLVYKSIWLVAVALPASTAGRGDASLAAMTQVFMIGVALDLLVIPWGFVYRGFVVSPGARWRAARRGVTPAVKSVPDG